MNKQTITKPAEALWVIDQYDYSRGVAFDTETRDTSYPERWAHGGSYEEGNPTGISLYNGKAALYVDTCDWTDEQAQDFYDVLGINLSKAPLIIGHNIIFDLGVLYKYGIDLEEVEWYDTMTAAHLIDEERKFKGGLGLKTLAELDLGVATVKSWEDTRHNQEEFQEYGVNDAVWTWQLAQKYSDELIVQDLDKLFREIEMPFHRVLLQMDVTGVGVDYARASEIADRSERVLLEYEVEMYDMLGVRCAVTQEGAGAWHIKFADEDYEPINFNSGQQVAEAMIGLGIELTETTPTGNWSTSKDVLKKIDHPFVKVLLKRKALRHVCSHFINKLTALVDSDGRMRPNWKNTGTVTGRMSSARPNFQNLPRPSEDPVGTRECVVAPEGYDLIGCDYSGQEVAILAHVSQDPVLIERMNNGFDIHLSMANDFMDLGIPQEKLLESHPEYKAIKEEFSEQRSKAKAITFGLSYGKSAYGFAEDFNITEEEGQEILDEYFERFPLVREAIEQAQNEARNLGYVTQYYGRRRRFQRNKWGRIDKRAMRQAFNHRIQSTAADMIRCASINCYKHIKEHPEWDAQIIMQIHDELIVQVKEEYSEEAAKYIEKGFLDATEEFDVKFRAGTIIGKTYADCK